MTGVSLRTRRLPASLKKSRPEETLMAIALGVSSATLDTPSAIAINVSSGLLFFSDAGNLRVRKLTPVIVGPVNHAPVPDPVFNQSLNKNQTLNVALSATDADGD